MDTDLDHKFLAKAVTDTNKELMELQDKYMLASDTRSDGSTIPAAAAIFHAKIEDSVMTDDHSTMRTTTCSSSRKSACVDGVSITP